MLPAKYRKAVGRNFERGLDLLLVATGVALLVGAVFSEIRTSAIALAVTLVISLVALIVAFTVYSRYK